ncbi:MAG TPA: ferrochelatase [Nitrospirota bacterium]|nr:ferrochelatase [Nitrospirota bacterium]
MSDQTAIILIALGGPRSLDEVGPFMTAFMGRSVPPPVVAAIIERYKLIGGKSPLPELVKAQAAALEQELAGNYRVYEGFRYSHPTVQESFETAVKEGARRVIALSMSPFATEVTTGAYRSACEGLGNGETCPLFIASWHDNPLFVKAWQQKVLDGLKRFPAEHRENAVVIFTSHSIPVRYITAGDPYQRQVEETVKLVADGLALKQYRIAWQSRGARATEPWIEPDVETVLDQIAREGWRDVLEVPIGFTCDHMETLYDIDIVHRAHAKKLGIDFERAESLNTSPLFIRALDDVVKKIL